MNGAPSPASLFDLTGREALVTGAAGRLGSAFARALAGAGAHVWLAGRTAARLDALAAELSSTPGGATPLLLDVTRPEDIRAAARTVAQRTERLHVLVSNAHQPRSAAFSDVSADDFARAASSAAGAAHELILAFRPLLRRPGAEPASSVITIASMYAAVSPDPRIYEPESSQNPADYGAAKAGLAQYTRHAAVHLAAEGIRVNSISPGPFPDEDAADPAFLERLRDKVPLARLGAPDELATAVLFLASPHSGFVTGVDVPVDGGWTAW